MSVPIVVMDASAGVKWFRTEDGSAEARALLRSHIAGEIVIAVDTLFLYEVVAVGARDRASADVPRLWRDLEGFRLAVVPPGAELAGAAARQRAQLGCSLYDAFSAGLAELLRAPLYTADARAHAAFSGARLL